MQSLHVIHSVPFWRIFARSGIAVTLGWIVPNPGYSASKEDGVTFGDTCVQLTGTNFSYVSQSEIRHPNIDPLVVPQQTRHSECIGQSRPPNSTHAPFCSRRKSFGCMVPRYPRRRSLANQVQPATPEMSRRAARDRWACRHRPDRTAVRRTTCRRERTRAARPNRGLRRRRRGRQS